MKTLNILKGGMYSKDEAVVQSCLRLMTEMVAELNHGAGEIVGLTWDWFIKDNQALDDDKANVRGSNGNLQGVVNRRQSLNR